MTTLADDLRNSIASSRMATALTTLFGAIALLLAAIGLYGVISYSVSRRTREIGIRIALGAQAGDVLRLIIKQGMLMVLVGVTIGLTAAFSLSRLISGLLFGISANDPMTFAAVAMLLMVVAFLACYLPARRATRVDPMTALRCE
jgi:putative ABC transport system permease protein